MAEVCRYRGPPVVDSAVDPPAATADESDLMLLEQIAQLQRHLDALALTNACLVSQLDTARQGATEVQERVNGRARDEDSEHASRAKARRRRDDDYMDDEFHAVVHRSAAPLAGGLGRGEGLPNTSVDSMGSSVVTEEVSDDGRPAYRSSCTAYSSCGGADAAEFDGVDIEHDVPAVTYRSCTASFGAEVSSSDLLAAAQFDLDVLREAVTGLGALTAGGAAPSDAAVREQLAKLTAAMRAYLVV